MNSPLEAPIQLEHADLFHGELTHQMAEVYVRLELDNHDGRFQLRGRVQGPESLLGATLSAKFPVRDLGPGPTLLAQARITDPCFWTPKSPSLYRACIELTERERVVETIERPFGIRSLSVARNQLRLDGKRWVLRGVGELPAEPIPWQKYRDSHTAIVQRSLSDACCLEASRQGVLIVAVLPDAPSKQPLELRRLARWAAVAIAVVPGDPAISKELRRVAPNILLAQWIDPRKEPLPQIWADVAFCDATNRQALRRIASVLQVPVIAVVPGRRGAPLLQSRADCDRLQQSLAPGEHCAGFVVYSDVEDAGDPKTSSEQGEHGGK